MARADGEKEVALWFLDEVVAGVLEGGVEVEVASHLRARAEILLELGDKEAAAADLALAREHLERAPEAATVENLDADNKLVEAELARSPGEAIELLDDVVRSYRASAYHYRLSQALHRRARALESLGRLDEAERDLEAAIDELELQREAIDAPEERVAFFDRTRELLDAMIRFQLDRRRRPAAAFRYSEQAKARALADWMLTDPAGRPGPRRVQAAPAPTDPESLRRALPPGTTVVEYSSLPQSLAIWVLRRDGFAVQTVPVGAKPLEDLVRRLLRELERGEGDRLEATSSRLHDLLIRPVERHLAPGERVVAVPDGALHRLPFALLRDRRTGRFLVQDHVLSVAPSARVLVSSLRRDAALARQGDPRALVVVDPAFDEDLFPSLRRLEAARTEARIAGAFPGSRVLPDHAATQGAFVRDAGNFEILHFGGHSVINEQYPLLSQMLFAAQPGDPSRGVLYSGDLLGLRFARTRLAVLASCSTAAGKISRTEGVESLARPFLAAGVPAVVASLWDVNDEVTAELFGRFYGHLRQDFDPAAALRETQVESLEISSDELADPRSWSAFELIGGNAPER